MHCSFRAKGPRLSKTLSERSPLFPLLVLALNHFQIIKLYYQGEREDFLGYTAIVH